MRGEPPVWAYLWPHVRALLCLSENETGEPLGFSCGCRGPRDCVQSRLLGFPEWPCSSDLGKHQVLLLPSLWEGELGHSSGPLACLQPVVP